MIDPELRAYLERLENTIRVGFERTDLRFNEVRADIAELRTYVDRRFDRFAELMAGHFEYVLSEIHERLDRLEQRT